jgi:hypothetical protein
VLPQQLCLLYGFVQSWLWYQYQYQYHSLCQEQLNQELSTLYTNISLADSEAVDSSCISGKPPPINKPSHFGNSLAFKNPDAQGLSMRFAVDKTDDGFQYLMGFEGLPLF